MVCIAQSAPVMCQLTHNAVLVMSGALSHMIAYAGAAYKLIHIFPEFMRQLLFNDRHKIAVSGRPKYIMSVLIAGVVLAGSGGSMQEIAKENNITIFGSHSLAMVFIYICAAFFNVNGLFLYFSDTLLKRMHAELLDEALSFGRALVVKSFVAICKKGVIPTGSVFLNDEASRPARHLRFELFQARSPVMIKAVAKELSFFAYRKVFWRMIDDLQLNLSGDERAAMKAQIVEANILYERNDFDTLRAAFENTLQITLTADEIHRLFPVDVSSDDAMYHFFLELSTFSPEPSGDSASERLIARNTNLNSMYSECLNVNACNFPNAVRVLTSKLQC